jgi:hypothetical protein
MECTMPEFRIYTIGRDGHFSDAKNIECADDQEAIQEAQQAVDGHDVELWQRGRFIVRLSSVPPKAKILTFIKPDTAFDPESAAILGAAYDKAVAALRVGEQNEAVRDVIATRIIALAAKGERDPDRLCDAVLTSLNIPR